MAVRGPMASERVEDMGRDRRELQADASSSEQRARNIEEARLVGLDTSPQTTNAVRRKRTRHLIFNTVSIRAILDGSKTETRRVLKPQPVGAPKWWVSWTPTRPLLNCNKERAAAWHNLPGDRLWIREAWARRWGDVAEFSQSRANVIYRADGSERREVLAGWRSPIYMPRWASRIDIELTAVWVERLQDIHPHSISAEGVSDCAMGQMENTFAAGWDAINAKRGYPWASNPWVLCRRFRRVE